MRTSRRLLVVPVVLALAGSLVACGADPSTSSEQVGAVSDFAPVPVDSLPEVKEAAFVLSAANFSELGTESVAAKSYTLTASIGVMGQAIEMTGVTNGADAQITEKVPGLDTPIEIRIVGGVVYMNFGPGTNGLFWKVDASNPLAADMAQAIDDTSVAENIAGLTPAIVSVTPSGSPEEIDGVTAQPYEVVVDTTKLSVAQAVVGVDLPDQVAYTYWVGSDKLPRKVTFSLMGSTTEMLFSHWGEPVTIEAPAADQITTTAPAFA